MKYYVFCVTTQGVSSLSVARWKDIEKLVPNLTNLKILSTHLTFDESVKDALKIAGVLGLKIYPTKAVICKTTGEIFENQNKACKRYNILRSNMSHHLSGKRNSIKNLIFKKWEG